MTERTSSVLVWEPRSVQIGSFLNWGVLFSVPSVVLISFAVGSPLLALPLLMVLVVYVCMFRRALHIGLVADGRRIRVVNFWRTYEFDWADVVEIRDRSYQMGVVAQTTLGFVLRSDKTIPVEATSFPGKHGRAILSRLRHYAEPHHVPVNILPPRDRRMWGESFQPMAYEDRTTVPRPRKRRR